MANITTQTIRVDLSTGKVIPTAYTHQNDTARTLVFDMYNGGLPYAMTGNTVKFAYKSPIVDGQYSVITGSSMASGTVSGNKVTVTLPVAYTAISGVGMLTMIITPTSGTVRPVNIRLVVQKSADGADVVSGASDFPATLGEIAEDWLEENISIQIDDTLSVSGKAADAKVTGDEISELDGQIDDLKSDLESVNDVLFEKLVEKEYDELDSGSHYKNLNVTFSPEHTYKIILSLVGYTSAQIATIVSINTYSNSGNDYLVDALPFENLKAGENVCYYTPTATAKHVRIVYRSSYSSETNKSVWVVYDLTENNIEKLSQETTEDINNLDAKLDEHIDDFDTLRPYFLVEKYVNSWEKGGYSFSGSTAGDKNNSGASLKNRRRAELDTITNANGKIKIVIANGYKINLVTYLNDGNERTHSNYVSVTTQTDGEYEFEYDSSYQYSLCLRKSDGTDFDESTDNVLTSVTLNYLSSDSSEATSVDVIRRNAPIETVERLQQLNRPTRTAYESLGTPPLVLLHFSDIHGDQSCLSNVIRFYKHYKPYISDIIHTGDTVDTNFDEGIGFWTVTDETENVLNVIGNHDTLSNSVWIGKTMAESYARYFSPYIANWGVTYEADKTYYYKDYTSNNVRLIVLDVMHQTAEQLAWFKNILAATQQTSYHVLVAVHSRAWCAVTPFLTPWDDQPVASYNISQNDTSASDYPQNLSEDYVDAVDDFIDDGGNFICWIHGHTHYKILAKITGHERQIDIAVGVAAMPPFAWNYVQERTRDSLSEDNFNVLGIDTVSKIIRMTKIGVRHDRFMRDAETIGISYDTRTIL